MEAGTAESTAQSHARTVQAPHTIYSTLRVHFRTKSYIRRLSFFPSLSDHSPYRRCYYSFLRPSSLHNHNRNRLESFSSSPYDCKPGRSQSLCVVPYHISFWCTSHVSTWLQTHQASSHSFLDFRLATDLPGEAVHRLSSQSQAHNEIIHLTRCSRTAPGDLTLVTVCRLTIGAHRLLISSEFKSSSISLAVGLARLRGCDESCQP